MKPFLIGMLNNGFEGLQRTAQAVPDDKMTWKPLDNGRTALDLVGETGQLMGMVADLVESKGEVKPGPDLFPKLRGERADWTRDLAMTNLKRNHERLIAGVESLSDEELQKPVTLQMGGGMTMPLANWAMMAYRTYVSRFAQINYIQTLYGDFEPH